MCTECIQSNSLLYTREMIDRMVRHGVPAGLSTVAYQSSTLVELAVRNRINARQRAVSEYQIIKYSLHLERVEQL